MDFDILYRVCDCVNKDMSGGPWPDHPPQEHDPATAVLTPQGPGV